MAGGRVSDSRPWLGKKQALSEQDHDNWGGPETKTHEKELGASVSITIIIDIGRPRAVVRQRRIEGVPKLPDKTPESSLMTAS